MCEAALGETAGDKTDKAPACSHGAGFQQKRWEGDRVNKYVSKINADSGRKECARERDTVDWVLKEVLSG